MSDLRLTKDEILERIDAQGPKVEALFRNRAREYLTNLRGGTAQPPEPVEILIHLASDYVETVLDAVFDE
jgi:hypothetical protein